MTDTRPWRERNLAKIAEARRILQTARANRRADDEPDNDQPPPAEGDDK